MTYWKAITIATACLCLVPATSAAQAPNTEARAAFQEGVRQYSAHHYAEALESFRLAYRTRPHPSVLVNIANCQLSLNQPQQALQTFQRYLTDASATLSPEQRTEIESAMADARRHLATINVVVQPVGAEIYLDGDLVGTAPLRRSIETGSGPHVLEARSPGLTSQQFQARVEGGGNITVTLDLVNGRATSGSEAVIPVPVPVPVPVPAPTPPVPAPTVPVPVPMPVHTAVPAPVIAVTPVPAPVVQPSPHPQDETPSSAIPLATWVGGGVTVVAAGFAIGFGVGAAGQNANFNTAVTNYNLITSQIAQYNAHMIGLTPQQLMTDQSNLLLLHQQGVSFNGNYETDRAVAWIAGGIAIAGGIFTVGSYFFLRSHPTETPTGIASLRIAPTPDLRGFVLGGAF